MQAKLSTNGNKTKRMNPKINPTSALLVPLLLLVTLFGLRGLFGAGEVLAGDLDVARSSAPSFGDITAFECIQVEAGSPEATGILRDLDALAGGAHEGSRR